MDEVLWHGQSTGLIAVLLLKMKKYMLSSAISFSFYRLSSSDSPSSKFVLLSSEK